MALTVIPLSGLANDVVDSISAGAGGGGPRIANVQIANSSWGLLDDTAVSTDGGYVLINGSGFASGCSVLVANSQATPVTFANSSLLRVEVPAKSASTYAVYVLNPDGGTAIGINALTYSAFPAWATSSTLSGGSVDVAISVQLSASDATTYTLQAGSSLPANTTLASNGLFSGTITGINEETTYTFTVEATDAENQNTPRTFSITISVGDSNFKSTTLLLNADANTFVRDASNNSFNITVSGDTRPSAFSPYNTNWSNFFDGTGDYLNCSPTAFGTGNFTIECYVYFSGTSVASEGVFHVATASVLPSAVQGVAVASGASGGWSLYYNNGSQSTNTSLTAVLNTWIHTAVVRNSGTIYLYINGILNQSQADTANYTNTNAAIGGFYSTGFLMQGNISNFRIVNSALYSGTSTSTANFTVPTTPLTAVTNTSLLTCQSNRLIDNSTNNFTITKNGDVRISAFGPFTETDTTTGSAYFDGTGDYLTAPNSSGFDFGSGDFTIEAWVFPYSLAAAQDLFGFHAASPSTNADVGYTIYVGINNASNEAAVYNSTTKYAVTGWSITTYQWQHIAFVRTSGVLKLFINGVQVGSNVSASVAVNNNAAWPFYIGTYVAASRNFNGAISDLRVVKGTAVYTSAFTPPTAPLTAIANTQLLTLQNRTGITNHQFVDESGINHLFTRGGNASQGSFSPYVPTGWSGYFDGSGDALTIPDNDTAFALGTGNFTIEAWIHPTVLSGAAVQFVFNQWETSAGSDSNSAFLISINTSNKFIGQVAYGSSTSQIALTGTTTAAVNTWYHVALVRSGVNLTLYINGTAEATSTTLSSSTINNSNLVVALGYRRDATLPFTGYISNARIVKGNALYTTTFTPSINPLTPVSNTQLLILRSNTIEDDGPNRFAITKNGDVKIEPFSPFKSHTITANTHSVYFDGTGDELETASAIVSSTEYSIEAWVYANANTQGYIAAQYTAGNGNRTVFLFRETTGVLYFFHPNQGSQAAGTLNLNTWYHVAITRDSNARTRIFVDGILKATFTTAYTPEASSFSIGGNGEAGSNFNGYISNMRVFNGAIPADYQTASTTIDAQIFTPPTAPLTAVSGTSLLTCQSSTITDNSSNAFALTVNGNSQPTKFNPFGETITQLVEYSANTHGGSVYFDGTSDSLITTTTVPAIGTGDFTIDAWVYLLSAPSINGWIYGNRSGSATSGYLFISSSLVPVYGADAGSIDLTSSTAVKLATWNHIAVSRSGSTIRLFLNGILVASATNTNNYSYAGTQPVGYSSSGSAYTLNGYISDLRVVLGTALYKSSFIPPSTTLSAVSGTVFLLNNDRGGIMDVSGRNVLECVGNVRVSTDTKKYGTGSMYFDGTGDGLSLPANQNISLGTGDFTIEMWVNGANSSSPVGGSFPRLFTLGTAQGTGCIEVYNSSSTGITVAISAGTNITFAGGTLLNSTWNHFAITRSGTSLKAFVNGTQVGSTNTNSTNLNLAASTQSWIGSISASAGNFTGYIDDLRITKGVARYTTNFTAPISALITK